MEPVAMSAKLLLDMVSEVRDLEREVRRKAMRLQMLRATRECNKLKNRVQTKAELLLKRKRHSSSAADDGEPVDANDFDEADDAAARPPKRQMNAAAGALQTAWRARGERVKDAPAAAPPDADAKAGATANHRAVRRFAQTSKATPAVRFAGGKAPASASPPASSPPASSQLPAAAPSAVETA